jgi:predicted dehydrogenase
MDEIRSIRWGILGTGMIAEKFASDLARSDSGSLRAAASRSGESAARFVEGLLATHEDEARFRHLEAVEGYDALLAHPDIDAVYIALPNTLHREWTIRALEAGKCAAANDRILIEAFMYRAHPQTRLLLDTIRSGKIGEIQMIRANFTFSREASRSDARYQSDAGGGSLMDVGCYCIDFARSLIGEEPSEMNAVFHEHEYGVDDYAAGSLAFPGGALATFTCGMTVVSDQTAHIAGTKGRIEIPRFWFGREGFTLVRPDREDKVFAVKRASLLPPLYAIEADAFAAVVSGAPNWNPPENTIGNMRVLDVLRG